MKTPSFEGCLQNLKEYCRQSHSKKAFVLMYGWKCFHFNGDYNFNPVSITVPAPDWARPIRQPCRATSEIPVLSLILLWILTSQHTYTGGQDTFWHDVQAHSKVFLREIKISKHLFFPKSIGYFQSRLFQRYGMQMQGFWHLAESYRSTKILQP